MMWFCVTYNGPKYAYQIFYGTVKREYIYIIKTTTKDTFNWYGFDSENYFKQYDDSKYTVKKLIKQWLKNKNFNAD